MKPAKSRAAALAIAAVGIPMLLLANASSQANTYHPPHSPPDTQAALESRGAALDIFDIGRHLQEYKQSISKAHSLVNAADMPASERHRSVSESIRRSLESYNGFLLQAVLRRF